jgi:hypothetical protein
MAYTPDAGLPRGLDYRCACEILAAVVKAAMRDVRTGAEPHASEAATWLDDHTGTTWRRVLAEEKRGGRPRKKAS